MNSVLQPNGRPMLIGSQPLDDHGAAAELVWTYTPEIPTWVQLPVFSQEGMVDQFVSGLPGLLQSDQRTYVDWADSGFDEALLAFFEIYLSVIEHKQPWDESPFVISPQAGQGFYALLKTLADHAGRLFGVKGQITGPITFCTALKDQEQRAIFYHDALRDAAVKLIALKAAWQVKQLSSAGVPVIVFIDEPALAGYGSSEFISISQEDITACLQEVIAAIHDQGGAAGVHVCANTDWSLLLESEVDIINFDAHGYFDKFILYAGQIQTFLKSGRCLAWGLVPTLDPEQIEAATLEILWQDWLSKSRQVCDLGIDAEVLHNQSFITPSCGTGSLSPELSLKVLTLTKALSDRIRSK